ncbi:hypothetical protein ACFQ6U_09750 [Streptomyces sp. NPDC056465]|uniref:hypothetical protein n=1 Tax=unclassified Streptomyces TaxID=2593676 RepID=UPI00369B17F7
MITGAGPLAIGYVLIVPDRHVGDIATALRADGSFLSFVKRALAEYEELFGKYTVWEHGSASLDVRTSGCVAHAHLNVIPEASFAPPANSRALDDWADLAGVSSSPYLLLGGSGASLLVGDDSGVSQHYRRAWAQRVGDVDRWDYALPGGTDLQTATAERYGAW